MRRRDALALIAAFTSAPVFAQSCQLPALIEDARVQPPPPGAVRQAKTIGYSLALSWSPQYCRRGSDPIQCSGDFGFILHGLWPEGAGRDDPAWCRVVAPLPAALLRRHLCMTPSVRLLQHEWARHGSCMSATPERYFNAAAILWRAYRPPDMARFGRRPTRVALLQQAFARQTPGLRPEAVAIITSGDWLSEVRICLDRALKPARCAPDQRGAAPDRVLRIWQRD